MSQKKVDRYKNYKSNRSKAARKEKMIDRLEILAWVMIAVAMVGWIGYSAYVKISSKQASIVVETAMDTTALDDYLDNLSAETEEDTTEEDTTEEDTTEEADTSESSEETDEAETDEASDTAESTESDEDTSQAEETAEASASEEDAGETAETTAATEDTDASSEE